MEKSVDVRAPREGEFFRINPVERQEVVLTRDEKGELYLIAPELVPDLMKLAPERLEHCVMFMASNSDGEIFLWPVIKPVPDDHPAYVAMDKWISLRGMQ